MKMSLQLFLILPILLYSLIRVFTTTQIQQGMDSLQLSLSYSFSLTVPKLSLLSADYNNVWKIELEPVVLFAITKSKQMEQTKWGGVSAFLPVCLSIVSTLFQYYGQRHIHVYNHVKCKCKNPIFN